MDNWTIHNILPLVQTAPINPDRGGYTLTMRENAGAEDVVTRLANEPAGPSRAHIGWGSFRNLDIAAARHSQWIVLLDINRHQFRVWDGVRAALNDPGCSDARSFVEIVVPLLPHEPRLRQFVPDTRDWLLGDLTRPGSWLFAERPARFAHIRSLFRDNRAVTGCVDLRAAGGTFAELARRIASAAKDGSARFDTLYVSNLPWMLAQREGFFGESNAKFAPEGSEDVLDQVRANLGAIAPHFHHVISAAHLADTSREGDFQWQTELLAPADFLAGRYWSPLTPVDTAFRSLS